MAHVVDIVLCRESRRSILQVNITVSCPLHSLSFTLILYSKVTYYYYYDYYYYYFNWIHFDLEYWNNYMIYKLVV